MKRILSTLLSLVLVLSMIPMSVFAGGADAVLYTETDKTTVSAGDTFEYTISLSGTYDGYGISVAKEFAGLSVTVTGESGVNVDDFGDSWMISVLGGLGREDSEKTKIATATVTVGDAATGTIALDFVDGSMVTSEAGDEIAFDKTLASVTVEAASVVVPTTAAVLYTETEATTVAVGDTFEYTISLSGTYDGYGISVAKEFAGLSVTVTGESGVNVDDFGDSWMISVLGGLGREDSEKTKIATATVTVGDAATGTIALDFVDGSMVTSEAGDEIAFDKTLASVTVEAAPAVVPVTGITLDKTEATLTEGDSLTLVATVAPEDATDKTLTWTSSDDTVATVADGVVTALKAGTATITVKAGDATAECAITVEAAVVPVTGVTLDKTEATLTEGDNLTLVATVAPENATDKSVTWTSSDESVATVSNGVVTAVKAGTATITAASGDETAECTVTVEAAPEEKVLTFKVGGAKAIAGKQVKVDVAIENNPGVAGMVLEFDYNTDVMTLVGYEAGADFEVTSNFDDPNYDKASTFFAWVSAENYAADGTILTLVFNVNEDAPVGDYAVSVSCPDDIVANEALEALEYRLVSGKITVSDVMIGDIYSDGIIDIKDAIALAQYLAQWTDIENFDIAAADCYADGEVNINDAILLAQYLAWDGVVLG